MIPGENRRKISWREWLLYILMATTVFFLKDAYSQLKGKADKEVVEQMREDLRDIRSMMVSHIIETGAGKVPPGK